MLFDHDPIARRSRLLVALAMLTAVPLRVWPVGRLGLNQFDEGIYAMTAGWVATPGGLGAIDPGLIPYAPPGYPILIGLATILVGSPDQAAFLVSAGLGVATIPIVARLAGRLFGPSAAAVSAWVACLSGPHVAFSRMALTDASFLFVWALGLWAGMRFLERPGLIRGVVMGMTVGLAQQFKYNGWLLGGMIVAAAILGEARAVLTGGRRDWVRLALGGGLGVAVAAAIVTPWYLFVERHGGYAGLLRHQRGYLGGWSGWWPHLVSQSRQAVRLSGPSWMGLLAAGTAGLACWGVAPRRAGGGRCREVAGATLAGVGVWPLLAAPAISGLLVLLSKLWGPDPALRFLSVSWVVLLVLTPFYHPYARLWLPFDLIHWLVLGGLAVRLGKLPWGRANLGGAGLLSGDRVVAGLVGTLLGGCLVAGPGFPLGGDGRFTHVGLFAPSDSLRHAVAAVLADLPPGSPPLRTLIRPAMSYDLGARVSLAPQDDVARFETVRDFRELGLIDSTILARPPLTVDQARRAELPASVLKRWEVVATIPSELSLPTALDLDPIAAAPGTGPPYATFWLIRPRRTHSEP